MRYRASDRIKLVTTDAHDVYSHNEMKAAIPNESRSTHFFQKYNSESITNVKFIVVNLASLLSLALTFNFQKSQV